MISAYYIASSANRLDLELKIIRHFLLHPQTKEVRDAFVASEMADREKSMARFLGQKADRDSVDDMLVPVVLKRQKQWLENNLSYLREFSENRFHQMELILRYTLFEGFLQKIVGNILWEYPKLRADPIHFEMRKIVRLKSAKTADPEAERIAWTKAVVDAVDRLPFDKWDSQKLGKRTIYLWQYIRDVFKLEFHEKELWSKMERIRQVRNHIIHRSMELTISGECMDDARIYLGNLPTYLCQRAAKVFPKACTEEQQEEGDDGTPAYVLLEEFF